MKVDILSDDLRPVSTNQQAKFLGCVVVCSPSQVALTYPTYQPTTHEIRLKKIEAVYSASVLLRDCDTAQFHDRNNAGRQTGSLPRVPM